MPRDDATAQERCPYIGIAGEYAKLLAMSVKRMNGNISDVVEKCGRKHKCREEEFLYVRKLWCDAVNALECTINTARYLRSAFKSEWDSGKDTAASVKLCKKCMKETNRLLVSGYGENIISGTETGDHVLMKRLGRVSESYAADVNQAVGTLIGRVTSNEVRSYGKHEFSEKAFQKMEELCRFQADVSYSAAEISAYFKNLRPIRNRGGS